MNDSSDARGRKVLLIFPPMQEYIYGPQWRSTESPTAPLGLMYLATPLIKAGYRVDFIDFTVDQLNQEDYFEALKNADFILISCYSQALGNILKIIRDVRLIHKDASVLCGGPHCNETEMHVEGSDMTVYGEADQVIVKILGRISSKGSFDDIPGISYCRDGQIVRNPGFHIIADLDALEFPSFRLARKKKYGYLYGVKLDHIAGIMTSRGCPFQCTFCTFRRTKFRERAVDEVILEIQRRIEEGAKYIVFFDDNFLLRRNRTVEIMDEIIEHKFPVKFAIQGRVDLADDDLYGKFKKAGVRIMIFGVESANQDVLDFYKKDTTVQEIRRAIALADQWGLITFGTLIVGAPMENYSHFEADKKFFREVPLDVVSIHILNYCCGSVLWEDACEKGLIEKKEIHVAADKRLSNFSTEELAGVQNELIRSFYNDPKRILRLLYKFTTILGASFIFKLMKMFLRGTIYRSSNTFHGAVTKNVRL
ncbi:MAG: radical SAM protein [Candidatus Aminicenantes bacterium]|nr:radical SAM protein [Candidatus Aminicenantes bacterium]